MRIGTTRRFKSIHMLKNLKWEQKKICLPVFTSMLLLIILLVPRAFGNSTNGDAILGSWSTMDREARFDLYKCGSEYCGKISYLQEPNYPPAEKQGLAGLPKTDRNNPDPQLRGRHLLGLPLLEGFRYAGGNSWEGGRIYNPEDGRKYRCRLWLDEENRLKLRGYVGLSLLGKTETWIR
jgi:uncharacterized protein (DUF2147 family)